MVTQPGLYLNTTSESQPSRVICSIFCLALVIRKFLLFGFRWNLYPFHIPTLQLPLEFFQGTLDPSSMEMTFISMKKDSFISTRSPPAPPPRPPSGSHLSSFSDTLPSWSFFSEASQAFLHQSIFFPADHGSDHSTVENILVYPAAVTQFPTKTRNVVPCFSFCKTPP